LNWTPWKKKHKRGFDAADTLNRLVYDWVRAVTSADTEIRNSLTSLRAGSRELERNNDYHKRFLNLCEINIIGHNGFVLQNRAKQPSGEQDTSANQIIEAAWQDWCRKGNCTTDGEMSFWKFSKTVLRSVVRDGEVIIRKVKGYNNKYKFALQAYEADYLDETYNVSRLDNGNTIRMGVEFDQWGKRVAYWMLTVHPGDINLSVNRSQYRIRIDASEIIHLYVADRFHQSRGVPWAHTAMTRIQMVGKYEYTELVAARVGAAQMAFFMPPAGVVGDEYKGDGKDNGNIVKDASPGQFEVLPPGYDVKTFDPNHPNTNYNDFIKGILRGVSSGLGVSYNSLSSDYESVNYSSGRLASLDERDMWRLLQRWVIEDFLNIIFSEWLDIFLISGLTTLPYSKLEKFNAPFWQPRVWDWVDPSSDIDAVIRALDYGLTTKSMELMKRGLDFDDTLEQLKTEKDSTEKSGLQFGKLAEILANMGLYPKTVNIPKKEGNE
jgi:lambda family phage portal protein